MQITWFSVLMAIISSSLMMIFVFLFRRRISFINMFGIPTIIIMLFFCFFRMAFFVEFPNHQHLIEDPYLMSFIFKPFVRDNYEISTKVMLLTWIIVLTILLIQLGISQYISHKKIRSLNNTANEKIFDKLVEIDKEKKLTIIRSESVPTPMLAGIIHPVILLPEIEYTNEQIEAVIKHEYTHWKNKDNIIKLVIQIFWRVFWWNPFAYLFLINLSKILELKCDKKVTFDMTDEEKFDYLQSMLDIIRKTKSSNEPHLGLVTSYYVKEKNKFDINQRFEYVLSKPESKLSQSVLRVLVIVLMIVIFCTSYYFILQPKYDTTSSDIVDSENVQEVDSSNGYILKKGEDYYVVLTDGSLCELQDKNSVKQMMNSGFKIIEEE